MSMPGKSTRPLKKRRIVSVEPEEPAVDSPPPPTCNPKAKKRKAKRARTTKKQNKNVDRTPSPSAIAAMKKSVTWNDPGGNRVHLQPDPTQVYPFFNESDLWYTRDNYKDFLMDRLQTIESHRNMTSNNTNESGHCIRGLELFQDELTNENFQKKKNLYHSTIKMEQIRQAMLGINDPERFRALVAPQSDLALHRARELAAQDEREVYPFRAYSAGNDIQMKAQSLFQNMSTGSFSDMQRLKNIMESIYGNASPTDTRNSNWSNTPAPYHEDAAVVSDASSTSSTSSESSTGGQSLFADESIRKLQERSMRRLMGIYQNNRGEGLEGDNETNALFKYARRDSLLGIRNNDNVTGDNANASGKNRSWAVPEEQAAPSPREQLLEFLHRRQLQEEQQQQQAAVSEDTASLEEQLVEMLHHRKLLQEHLHLHQQQQQQAEGATPSLQEQLAEMIQRRQLLEEHHLQQQQQRQQQQPQPQPQISSVLETIGESTGNDNRNTTTTSLIEQFLIREQQHQQDHQSKMQEALAAMQQTTRFPIRRDTLSLGKAA